MFLQKSLLSLAVAVVMVISTPSLAQVAFSELPDAPTPNLHPTTAVAHTKSLLLRQKKRDKFEILAFRGSQVLVLAGLYADTSTTISFMRHPQHVRYRAMCTSTTNGVITPIGDCGVEFNSFFPKQFVEEGWAVKTLGIGNRNTVAVNAANIILDTSFLVATELLHRSKSSRLKKLATTLNLVRAGTRFYAAQDNRAYLRGIEKRLLPQGANHVVWYNPKL